MAPTPHDTVAEARIRPMRPDDLEAAERLSSHAFLELDRALVRLGDQEPSERSARSAQHWIARTARFLDSDAAGCWVADVRGEMVGFATSFRRETTWFLATYAVTPDLQGLGLGKALLDAALTHSRGCLHGMLSASADPRAARRYRLAGFDLHPQMTLEGVVDDGAVPDLRHVRDGTLGDREWMDSLDRATRGAARGADHEFLGSVHPLRVVDDRTGRGYAYRDERGVVALAAANRRTASRLLWDALASVPAGHRVAVRHVTAANQWALDVGMAAGLTLRTDGYLGVWGLDPPAPYLHHGALL